jgi:hypothetical protein
MSNVEHRLWNIQELFLDIGHSMLDIGHSIRLYNSDSRESPVPIGLTLAEGPNRFAFPVPP